MPRDALLSLLPFPLLWSAFCLRMWSTGHGPSRTLLPIPPEQHYLAQAVLLVPTMLFAWWLWTRLLASGAKVLGGSSDTDDAGRRLARAYGLCGVLLFVAPEWMAFEAQGMNGIRSVMLWTGPACLLMLIGWSTKIAHEEHALPWGRAVLVALLSFVLHALPVSLVLR